MSPAEQRDSTWVYWRARALQGLAGEAPGLEAEARRTQARELYASVAGELGFYGTLAGEELGRSFALPPRPAPLTPAERRAALDHPGLGRALLLIGIGLRNEGVREWNYSLRGMGDRELLAAAQLACERQIWDRCINTSDRTRAEIDMEQRFPTPFRPQVLARTREIGLDAAYVYGLIRQESRFITDARSGVGASGLMQVMPGTAKLVAKRLGIDYRPDMLTDRDANLMLGTSYLKFVLDDFGGSEAMAAAAYNAGPGRPRRWREGPLLEPAIWAENVPFAETRDYVKKVLANRIHYAAVLGVRAPSLKAQLGRAIGPRDLDAPAARPHAALTRRDAARAASGPPRGPPCSRSTSATRTTRRGRCGRGSPCARRAYRSRRCATGSTSRPARPSGARSPASRRPARCRCSSTTRCATPPARRSRCGSRWPSPSTSPRRSPGPACGRPGAPPAPAPARCAPRCTPASARCARTCR